MSSIEDCVMALQILLTRSNIVPWPDEFILLYNFFCKINREDSRPLSWKYFSNLMKMIQDPYPGNRLLLYFMSGDMFSKCNDKSLKKPSKLPHLLQGRNHLLFVYIPTFPPFTCDCCRHSYITEVHSPDIQEAIPLESHLSLIKSYYTLKGERGQIRSDYLDKTK